MKTVKSIWLDASIAVGIASLTSLALSMAGKESYEYVNPFVRYWLIVCVGVIVQGLHALSKFRDGTFQRHKEAVDQTKEPTRVETIEQSPIAPTAPAAVKTPDDH